MDFNLTSLSTSKYPRLIIRYINSYQCGNDIVFTCKPYILLHSNVGHGIYLDADTFVTHEIDMYFNISRNWKGSYTLSMYFKIK